MASAWSTVLFWHARTAAWPRITKGSGWTRRPCRNCRRCKDENEEHEIREKNKMKTYWEYVALGAVGSVVGIFVYRLLEMLLGKQ